MNFERQQMEDKVPSCFPLVCLDLHIKHNICQTYHNRYASHYTVDIDEISSNVYRQAIHKNDNQLTTKKMMYYASNVMGIKLKRIYHTRICLSCGKMLHAKCHQIAQKCNNRVIRGVPILCGCKTVKKLSDWTHWINIKRI